MRLEDGEAGLAAHTIKRRLARLSSFFAYVVAREGVDIVSNRVPAGLGGRRPAQGPAAVAER